MALQADEEAPDFNAEASNGKSITLESLRGSWVVLYFYPKDETPGCTKEACAFRDSFKRIESLGAVVLGCSPDDLKTHDKFITRHNLPFTLLTDPDRTIAKAYGVWKEKNMYGKRVMGIERSTFLINPAGTIHFVWPKVKVDGHVDEIVDELKLANA